MEIDRCLSECPYCKNPVTVGSKGRNTAFKILAVLALVGVIGLLLGNVLPGLLRYLFSH